MNLQQAIDQLSAIASSLQKPGANPFRNVLTRAAAKQIASVIQDLCEVLAIDEAEVAYSAMTAPSKAPQLPPDSNRDVFISTPVGECTAWYSPDCERWFAFGKDDVHLKINADQVLSWRETGSVHCVPFNERICCEAVNHVVVRVIPKA